ncbi:unnamed protein product [Thelazia callipaeda]|uniref:receptor protein-tyrosine kinase n=1 Tax=Thelazia callipaeda TaxID=103827 RepID=A0A158RAN9_THECL|nr:unnamed protein product [Thelazia callipaeda]
MNETDIILVHLPNGTAKSVRFDFQTKVQKVICVVLSSVGIYRVSFKHFALRLKQISIGSTCSKNDDCQWLHSSLTMRDVYDKFFSNQSNPTQQRFELRIRFIPKDLQEMYQTQLDAFMFLHEQVLADYLTQISWKVPEETAMELAALQIRKELGSQNMCAVEKFINLDELEAGGTLSRLLPQAMLAKLKSKQLRKALVAAVKRHIPLTSVECIFRFLEIVKRITQFDIEIFKASLGMVWKYPLDVMVGMVVGISYVVDGRCEPTLLAQLQHVSSLVLSKSDNMSQKTIVSLKISGSTQHLNIILPTWSMAESLAHLIDGYHILLQQGSIWAPSNVADGFKMKFMTISVINKVCINRSQITLEELLGDGQFGNVYKGTFTNEDNEVDAVAIKVCKIDNEIVGRHNFVEEAFTMNRFHHQHIIALIGICVEMPVWIVMELAPFGELRQYLICNCETVDLSIQLLFSEQLSSAIFYLHSCKYVHRDIAARNVLVSSPRCVKLSDFGLSRCVQDENFYTASQGKLPIKWMAPESINYRRFSTATDVWMFGVCLWEILMFGMKPWQGVRNQDIVMQIEMGERLQKPSGCPRVLYELMLRMWNFEPSERPSMFEVNRYLSSLLDQIDLHLPYESLTAPSYNVAPVLEVDSETMPTSTLWRTLEQQRIQSEEDDRWLEEEEEKLLPLPALSTIRAQHVELLSKKQPLLSKHDDIPSCYQIDRRDDPVNKAIFTVVGSITYLSKKFQASLTIGEFSKSIKVIISELENLLKEFSLTIPTLNVSDQDEVKLVGVLLESDLRNLSEALRQLSDEDNSRTYHASLQRKVLKITHRLAFNCKQLLVVIDSARIRSGVAKFQPKNISSSPE